MVATSRDQSKHLLELGLDPNTADMYYTGHRSIHNPKEIEYTQEPRVRTKFVSFDRLEVFFPAWSLQALLDIMPEKLTDGRAHYYLESDLKSEIYYCAYANIVPSRKGYTFKANILDAAFEMVKWLLKMEIIKKSK